MSKAVNPKPKNQPINPGAHLLDAIARSKVAAFTASGMARHTCASCGRAIYILKTNRHESDSATLTRAGGLCDGCSGRSADVSHRRD